MEHKNRSVLQFERYIVKEIQYYTNELFLAHEGIALDFDFNAQSYFSDDNQKLEVELNLLIFKDAVKKNYPFEMSLSMKGFFNIKTEDENIHAFESNAIAILFPYARAIVSTYTANANVAPVILPPMNINAYLRKKHNQAGGGD